MKKILSTSILISNLVIFALNANADTNLKNYNKYDFIAGDKIIFEDYLKNDKISKSPMNWVVGGGEALVNKINNENLISITKYYTILTPKIKKPGYLPNAYTIEFDYYLDAKYDGNPGVSIHFNKGDEVAVFTPNRDQFNFKIPGGEVNGNTPAEISGPKFYDKWHHIALSYKNNQAKVYADQYLVLSVPKANFKANSIVVKGDASEGMKMYFKNFKLAEGGEVNIINKALATGKFITHGIRFDTNKAVIKPESMGVLNEVAKYLKANPGLKFEIGGHTDSDGDDSSNMKLSQDRSDVVKNQLIDMGVSASQLFTKGYGETKPVSDNKTVAGKAANRRVEFIKK